jgi:hypothetical protein
MPGEIKGALYLFGLLARLQDKEPLYAAVKREEEEDWSR